MKHLSKKALAMTISIFFAAALAAQPQPTRRTSKSASSSTAPLENNFDTYFYYNQEGHLYLSQADLWDGNKWGHYFYDNYTLNPDGKPSEILRRYNSNNQNLSRQTFTYHTDGQYTLNKLENWNNSTQAWELSQSSAYEYNASNKVAVAHYESNQAGTLFVSRTTNTYDGQGRVAQSLSESFNNGAWENSGLDNYHYAGNSVDYDTLTETTWNTSGFWNPVLRRHIQTVDVNKHTIKIEQADGSGGFTPNNQTISIAGPNDVPALFESQTWNSSTGDWKTGFKLENDFNPDNSQKQYRSYFLDFLLPNQPLYLNQVADFYYDIYLETEGSPHSPAEVSIWPNPATDFVNVLSDGRPMSLRLLDRNGRLVEMSTSMGGNAKLELSGQPAGVYLLQIEQGGSLKIVPVLKK